MSKPTERRRRVRSAKTNDTRSLVDGRPASGALIPPSPIDTGLVENGTVRFPPWRDLADTPTPPPPAPLPPSERVGFAVVGLGRLALEQILPAFAQCKKAKLVALVSGSPEKMHVVARQYGIPDHQCYSYETFDSVQDNPDVRAVYIVLPNSMHRSFCERSAQAGKHVLTEKPMTVSSHDGQAMVAACAHAGVKLMVAYRVQYEPYNRWLMHAARDRKFGRLLAYHGINTQTVAKDGAQQWRHKKDMAGGGSLVDIGLYCLNTARFVTGEEPIEIFASSVSPPDDPRFEEVEETVSFVLRFPSSIHAHCFTSYGARDDKHQRLNFATATVDMPNCFQYTGQQIVIVSREGSATSKDQLILSDQNQFALEIDHFADCILTGKNPNTPGEEGVQDHRLMEAIYESARTGKPVRMPDMEGRDLFRRVPPREEI